MPFYPENNKYCFDLTVILKQEPDAMLKLLLTYRQLILFHIVGDKC